MDGSTSYVGWLDENSVGRVVRAPRSPLVPPGGRQPGQPPSAPHALLSQASYYMEQGNMTAGAVFPTGTRGGGDERP